MVSQHNPVKLFVTHAWDADDDYHRVFEFLGASHTFFYTNFSAPDRRPAGGREAEREELRRQIAPAEAVIALASQHRRASDLIEFEIMFAKASSKPVIVISSFGATSAVPKNLIALADESIDWDERAIVDAVKRQARHEETTRWDSIEFKLD